MSWKTARQALNFAFSHTLQQAATCQITPSCQLGFFGGEPLLEWELLQRATAYAIAETTRLGIRLKRTVTTNMSLLDEPRANWLLENRFFVGLSLDGHQGMHDTLRQTAAGRPSHDLCARALSFFRGPDANGEVIVVVDPRTVSQLADAVAWLISQDIRRISLNPNFTTHWDQPALDQWQSVYHAIGNHYLDAYRRNQPVAINVIDGKIRARIIGGYRPCDQCGFGENEVAVSAKGFFYPCERLVGDDSNVFLRIGHASTGFDHTARHRLLAMRGNQVPECTSCPVRDRCVNWCGCVNYANTGFIDRVPGIVCHHEQLSIATADRVGTILFTEKNPAFIHTHYAESTKAG